jgi:hypothetical protein
MNNSRLRCRLRAFPDGTHQPESTSGDVPHAPVRCLNDSGQSRTSTITPENPTTTHEVSCKQDLAWRRARSLSARNIFNQVPVRGSNTYRPRYIQTWNRYGILDPGPPLPRDSRCSGQDDEPHVPGTRCPRPGGR